MNEQEKLPERKHPEVNEVNLSEIFGFVKKYALRIIIAGFLFGVAGYGLSFLLPVTYVSSATLIPESGGSASGMGSLSGLARLSGLGRNESGGAIQPELYPAILQTIPFALHLLKQPIVDENNKQYKSVEAFLHRDDEPAVVVAPPKKTVQLSKEILSLSKSEDINTQMALGLVFAIHDPKTGNISISSETSDPVVSAQMVEIASNYLVDYVTKYRAEKSQREVAFLKEGAAQAKKREESAEYALQSYRDRNRNPFLNVARIEETRLQADYMLAQSLYSDIVRKYEEAKIKVKEDQPVIKVLEPAKVPLVKSKPKRSVVALGFAVFGAFMFLVYVIFFREKYHKLL